MAYQQTYPGLAHIGKRFFTDYPLLYFVLISLMVLALLVWQVMTRIEDFTTHQRQIAATSVTGAANEIATLLFELRRSVSLFAYEQAELLHYVAKHPEDDVQLALVEAKIYSYFPDVYAFTVTDDTGGVLVEDLPNLVQEVCQADIKNFINSGHKQGVYIHPTPDGYHFDIMVPLKAAGMDTPGVFFISFLPKMFVRVLANSQAPGHELMLLLQRDNKSLIEVTANGVRDVLERSYFLDPQELARIAYAVNVPYTLWRLVDLPLPNLLVNQKRWIWTQAITLFLVFLAASLLLLFFIKREESRRTLAEQSLRESHGTLRALIECIGGSVYLKDLDGRYRMVNAAFASLSGKPASGVIGQGDRDIFPLVSARRFIQADEEVLQTGEKTTTEETDTTTEQICLVTRTVCRDAAGGISGVIGIRHDITDLKRAQEQLRQHEHELAHVDRLSIMGEMASNLAHELGQPLGAVVNYAQACLRMVRRGTHSAERLSPALQQTVEQAQRAGAIIHRIRDFVRKDRPRAECLDLISLTRETLEFVSSEARSKGVKVAVEAVDDLLPVRADRIQIEQVLLNLIFNSFDAMRQTQSQTRAVTIGFRSMEGKVRVTVADTGPGLGGGVMDRIFEPFYTTKDKGMGMGLAICRSIIEAHSGRLWADSENSAGAVFHFTLPVDEKRCK